MIPNQWYVIYRSQELRGNNLASLVRLGERLVLWRNVAGQVVCMRDLCPHRGAALSSGCIVNDCIECPYHGFLFDSDGHCRLIPANGKCLPTNMKHNAWVYPTHEEHGFIWMWWGERQEKEKLPSVPWFEELDSCESFTSPPLTCSVHYSRFIENLLDVAHLAIVHAKSFGSILTPTVDTLEKAAEWDGKRLKVKATVRFKQNSRNQYMHLLGRDDDGSPPLTHILKSEDCSQEPFDVQFIFPGFWRVRYNVKFFKFLFPEHFYSFVAVCPVDEQTTLFYVSAYQKLVRIPVFKEIVGFLANLYDRKIGLQEDRAVVEKQYPKKSYHGMKERLIAADYPIILYREQRQRLIDAAGGPRDSYFENLQADNVPSWVNKQSFFKKSLSALLLTAIAGTAGWWAIARWEQAKILPPEPTQQSRSSF